MEERIGQVVGGCRLTSVLGQGGFGTTYLAQHEGLDHTVVVKVLEPKKIWGKPEMVERFLAEGKAMARIQHTAVVQLRSAGMERDLPYLVLEYVRGESLRQRLRGGKLDPEQVVEWLAQTGEGLGAVHEAGLIHRDFKPDNLLIDEEDCPKLVDFGLAVQAGDADMATVLGTPAYMAPEQCVGRPLDARTDVYSLGVTLYECLCDRWPFNAPEPRQILKKHVKDPPPLDPLRKRSVPEPVVSFVERCLAKDPDGRPQDGAAFAEELWEAWETKAKKKRRRKRRKGGRSTGGRKVGGRSTGSRKAGGRSTGSRKVGGRSTGARRAGLSTSGRNRKSDGGSLVWIVVVVVVAVAVVAVVVSMS